MQEVSERWIATNAAPFTAKSYITIWIRQNISGGALAIPPERILSYTQSFTGDMLAGEIPEIKASVKLNNNDGYYSEAFDNKDEYEHAQAEIWIAFEVGSEVDPYAPESINGGTLFISDVSFDARERTATIKFSDILQFLNAEYTGTKDDWADEIIPAAISQAVASKSVPLTTIPYQFDEELTYFWQLKIPDGLTIAETLQVCANACNCVLYVDRDSKIHIEQIDRTPKEYNLSRDVQYVNPSLYKEKSINSVLLKYYDTNSQLDSYEYRREGQIGSQQTVSNPAIQFVFNAMSVARRTYRVLQENRTVISGEYRCDPRIDIFDCIPIASAVRFITINDLEEMTLNSIEDMTINEIETGYTDVGTYCMTSLEMTFTGSWHGRFTARAVDERNSTNLATWGDAKVLTWGQARNFSWDELKGGIYV